MREERRQELEAHVEAVNELLKEAKEPGTDDTEASNDEDWNGIQDDQPLEPIDHEAEYVDEDRYTTVTVEAVDISREGLHKIVVDEEEADDDSRGKNTPADPAETNAEVERKIWPKKTRKKRFRYESKAERKITRGKQKAGNKLKADARRRNG